MALTPSQIKQQELKLLQISGFCLAQFSDPSSKVNIFRDVTYDADEQQLQKLNVSKMRSSGVSSNANIKAFAYILLESIYKNQTNQQLLDQVKAFLLSKEIDLQTIRNHSLPQYTNKQMKKLMVQFFYSVNYSHLPDRVEEKLTKYPIILEIIVMFIRKLLNNLNVHNADNYIFHLPTQSVLEMLVEYFDLNCRKHDDIYMFYEEQLFIFQNTHGQVFFGSYQPNQTRIKKIQLQRNFNFSDLNSVSEDDQPDTERDTLQVPKRSIQIKGIVSQSLILDNQSSTPVFNLDQDDDLSSFKNSREPSLNGSFHRQSLLKQAKQASPLKKMDLLKTSQQLGLGSNLQMKKTIVLEDNSEVRDELLGPFQMLAQSPITNDSPQTLQIPEQKSFMLHFDQRHSDGYQKIKILKKSKSQIMNKSRSSSENDHSHSQIGKSQQINIRIKQPQQSKKVKTCHCVQSKKKKMKLNSYLYQVNMNYLNANNFVKKEPQFYQNTGILSHSNTPVVNIQVNQKTFSEKASEFDSSFLSGFAFKKVQKVFHRKNPLQNNSSVYSNYTKYCPESEVGSKRVFSPLSNTSKSPNQGSKSITPPKAKFNFKNPLKFSTNFKPQSSLKQRKYSKI